jgi:hypothetical protein
MPVLLVAITSVIAPILVGITLMVLNRRYKEQPERMEAIFAATGLSVVAVAIGVVLVIVGIAYIPDASFDWNSGFSTADDPEAGWKSIVVFLAFFAAFALVLLGPIGSFVSLVRNREVTSQQHAVRKRLAAEDPGARMVRAKPFTLKWTPKGADKPRTAAFDGQGHLLKPHERAVFERLVAVDPRASIVRREPFTLKWTPEGADKPVTAAFDQQGRVLRRGRAASGQDSLRSGKGAVDFTALLRPLGRGVYGRKRGGGGSE